MRFGRSWQLALGLLFFALTLTDPALTLAQEGGATAQVRRGGRRGRAARRRRGRRGRHGSTAAQRAAQEAQAQAEAEARAQAEAQAAEEAQRREACHRSGDCPFDEEGQREYDAGRESMRGGQYEEALAHFRAAYERSGRSELHYNIALAADAAAQKDVALEAYETYLRAHPESLNRLSIERRIRTLYRDLDREGEPDLPDEVSEGGSSHAFYEQWWFWTAMAVVVGAAVAIPIVVIETAPAAQPPLVGDNGGVFMTLVEVP